MKWDGYQRNQRFIELAAKINKIIIRRKIWYALSYIITIKKRGGGGERLTKWFPGFLFIPSFSHDIPDNKNHGANMGPVSPRWAPCWPHEPCYQGYHSIPFHLQVIIFMQRETFIIAYLWYDMVTSSNGNIFRVTGHLCGEFTDPGEFPAQRPVTQSFDVFVDLRSNKRLTKQWWGWWFEMPSCTLWRHYNELQLPWCQIGIWPWASCQIRKIAVCACAGNAGNVFPRRRLQRKSLVSDPGMHHGTCVTHVPWCMPGSLTRGGGENFPGIPGACAPAILRIW